MHRWYQPAIGRYTRPDPLRLTESGVNPYLFAAASPLVFVDPLGLRYINRSCRGITYKPEGNGPSVVLLSGGERDQADGFYEDCGLICGVPPGKEVFKTRDGVDIIFEGGCGYNQCVTWRYATKADQLKNEVWVPFMESGGWKDDGWIGQHPDWPAQPDCCTIPIPPDTEPPPLP